MLLSMVRRWAVLFGEAWMVTGVWKNAYAPMLSTLRGMVMSDRLVQRKNA